MASEKEPGTTTQAPAATPTARPDRDRIAIFRHAEAPPIAETGIMTPPTLPAGTAEFIDKFDFTALDEGSDVRVLFRHQDEGGFSLVYAWFAPDYLLPSHSHSADCMYYVLSGEAILGSHVVGQGDGFFVPAGRPYRYRAGNKGVEVLEFRHETAFDMRITESKQARWEEMFKIASSHREAWRAIPRPGRA
jgi:mannose-6-phosphate isomerase-like protein (cupin superfamily)